MKKLIILFFVALSMGGISLFPASVFADDAKTAVCGGIGLVEGPDGDCVSSDARSVGDIVHTAVNILSFIVGIAAILMIIVGGFKYITSGGDSNKVASAKNTIVYALVGLVVAALAQTLVRFVFKQAAAPPTQQSSATTSGRVQTR